MDSGDDLMLFSSRIQGVLSNRWDCRMYAFKRTINVDCVAGIKEGYFFQSEPFVLEECWGVTEVKFHKAIHYLATTALLGCTNCTSASLKTKRKECISPTGKQMVGLCVVIEFLDSYQLPSNWRYSLGCQDDNFAYLKA